MPVRGFFEELKYRNVFRVAVAYAVGAWLIAQIADLVADVFNAPETFMQMLVLVLLLGLPVALFLAWAYELTPEGVKKAHEVPPDAPKDPRSAKILDRVTLVALVVAVGWLASDKIKGPGVESVDVVVTDKSIAVLPFDDFSPEGNYGWFADGLTEEILNSLARTADLQVASRTSSFAFRDSNLEVPDIAAQLDVAHVLEGSVRRAGERIRVTAQLIRAADDKHLWSETFDGDSEDSIGIQETIAISIANALQTAMDPDELARMVAAGTHSVDAWETYLRAKAQWNTMTVSMQLTVEDFNNVIARLDHAVEIDPEFADAHLLFADLYQNQLDMTSTYYLHEWIPRAGREAAFRTALGNAIQFARSDLSRLESQLRLADAELRFADAINFAEQITILAPEKRLGWSWLQYFYLAVGDYENVRAAGFSAWPLDAETGADDHAIFEFMHRVSLPDAIEMLEEVLREPVIPAGAWYQAHRVLLADGQVERVAGFPQRYFEATGDTDGLIMMQVRQACAEGRTQDADQLVANGTFNSNLLWLLFITLGRDEEARAHLAPLDTPEGLFALSRFLGYVAFEARDYPLLWQTLVNQGFERPPATPLAYRCRR